MKKLLSFIAVVLLCTVAFAQSVTLTFTAKDAANQYVQLNRVSITNLTKGWQETIYWPDTTLTMQNGTGIEDIETQCTTFPQLSQNNPNPFTGATEVNLMVANEGLVYLQIADVNGKIVETQNFSSQQLGTHQFRITLATAGTYVMTVRQNGHTSSIKMVCNGGADANKMEYIGNVGTQFIESETQAKNAPKYTTTNPFNFGDQMEYVGYATINGTEVESQHITQVQNVSQSIILQFAETSGGTLQGGQPCPGAATVTDIDNNTYNTVQIGNQCWMKENLRTTCYANGTSIALGSSTSTVMAYRYYPNNDTSNVPTYGYLYNWPAVMGNSSTSSANPSGVQGICPTGWHVPSDAEWAQLIDYVSSQSQYVCGGDSSYIAKALASTTGWTSFTGTCDVGYNPSANNATGFSALPAGSHIGPFNDDFGHRAYFWSASEEGDYIAYSRLLGYKYASVYMNDYFKDHGFSVRCVRD